MPPKVDFGFQQPLFTPTKLPELNFQQPASAGGISNGVSRGLGVLTGLADITQMGIGLAQTKSSSPYSMQIQNYGALGDAGASSFNQLTGLYQEAARGVTVPTADELRGMDTGQKVGSILSSTTSGAMAGASFGLPGAIIGGLSGLAGGVVGSLVGDVRAQKQHEELAQQKKEADERNRIRFGILGDNISDTNFRQGVANIGKEGGSVRRISMEDFVAQKLSVPRRASSGTPAVTPKKQYCNGGLKVSFRSK